MERIVVYHNDDGSRDFHTLMSQMADYMEKNMGATWIRTYETEIKWGLKEYGEDRFLTVLDCEILIHYPDRDTFKGMTFADNHTQLSSFFSVRNCPNDLLLCSQYANTGLCQLVEPKFRWLPSLYVCAATHDHDHWYRERKLVPEYIDKFIFRGNVHAMGRKSAMLLENNQWFEGPDQRNHLFYFDQLTKYKVGLSIPGMGELCYRDIEYMAIGIPMMKFEYVTQLNPKLIPNYHYISIDRIDTEEDRQCIGGVIAAERNGGDRHVAAYIKRFLEVKDDREFLDFVSNNAREYYETYLHPNIRVDYAFHLLEIA